MAVVDRLAARERSAYLVSEAMGWHVVPLTVLREGPHGLGMVQQWQDPVEQGRDPVDVVAAGRVPAGYLHVLDAEDGHGRDVSLVHEDTPALRRMALFDVVVNNADRKGGHVLPMADGHRYGVDHGVSFHVEHKLRTVLWGWRGDALHAEEAAGVDRVRGRLDGDLGLRLAELLSDDELAALATRCDRLLRKGVFPGPRGAMPAFPWPFF